MQQVRIFSQRQLLLLVIFLIVFGVQASLASFHDEENDYYKILRVSQTAPVEEIQQQYETLATKYHPSRTNWKKRAASRKKFLRISKAYMILRDDGSRSTYDTYRARGTKAYWVYYKEFYGHQATSTNPYCMFRDILMPRNETARQDKNPLTRVMSWLGIRCRIPKTSTLWKSTAKHGAHAAVYVLNSSSYPVKSALDLWFVEFHADSRERAKSQAQLQQLANKADGVFKVATFDCSKDETFCANRGVQKYPSRGLVVNGKTKLHPNSGNASAKRMYEFETNYLPRSLIMSIHNVSHIDDRLLSAAVTGRNNISPGTTADSTARLGSILLTTDKHSTSPVYYSVAYKYRNQLVFGESRGSNAKIGAELGISKYPTLLAFVPKSKGSESYNEQWDIIRYHGEATVDAIGNWLDKILVSLSKHGVTDEM